MINILFRIELVIHELSRQVQKTRTTTDGEPSRRCLDHVCTLG